MREIPFGDNPRDTAVLLLAAAEDLRLPPEVVGTTSDGTFLVPDEVADAIEKPKPKRKRT